MCVLFLVERGVCAVLGERGVCVLLGRRGMCVLFFGGVVCVCAVLGRAWCVFWSWEAWCVCVLGARGVRIDMARVTERACTGSHATRFDHTVTLLKWPRFGFPRCGFSSRGFSRFTRSRSAMEDLCSATQGWEKDYERAVGMLSKATRERLDGVGLLDMTFVSEVAAEGVEELEKIFTPYLGMPNDEANDWAAFFEVTEVARRSFVKRRCLHVRAPQHALASLSVRLQFGAAEMGVVARTSLTRPLAPCAPVAKWPTRLRRQLAVTDDPREQQRLEEKDRDLWVRSACGILIEDCYTVSELAAGAGDGHIYLKRVFGAVGRARFAFGFVFGSVFVVGLRASGRCLRPCGKQGVCNTTDYLE